MEKKIMKGDKLDIKLREDLGQMSVEPPADMWARIEKGLGVAAAGQTTAADVADADVKPLRRRILSWTYAAAACLLAGILSIGLLLRTETPPAVAEDSAKDKTEVLPIDFRPAAELETEPAEIDEADNIAQPEANAGKRVRAAEQSNAQNEIREPVGQENNLIARIEPPAGDPAQKGETSPEKTPERTGNKQDKTSDMKQGERSAVPGNRTPWIVAEDNTRSQRRRTPISTSLFAANFGGINLGGDVPGTTRVANDEGNHYNSALKLRHRMPLTFGVNISYGITEHLSIETGLQYTYLYSDTDTKAGLGYVHKQKLHYLGVPLTVRYDFYNRRAFKLYGGLGGTIEKCVEAKEFDKFTYGTVRSTTTTLDAEGFQYSVNVAMGIQARISNTLGFYVEPGLNYFFDNRDQPESYRTQNSLSFSVKAGFRFNIR